MNTDKIEKYKSRVRDYNPEVKKWLVDLYSKHYNLLHFTIRHIIDKDDYFLLSYSEEDFINIATNCYSKLTLKYPYLRDEKEGIFFLQRIITELKALDIETKTYLSYHHLLLNGLIIHHLIIMLN